MYEPTNSKTPSALWNEADELMKNGNFEKAELNYTQYIECYSLENRNSRTRNDLDVAYNNRGQCRYKQVKFDEAIEDYDLAISHNDKLAVAYYNRGTIHYRMGDFEQARQDMQKTLELQPDFQEAQIALNRINNLTFV
ncbi:hypothetical protein CHUAL_013219 [Chamberlinius hualienensis]